jgi:hypothetical protein
VRTVAEGVYTIYVCPEPGCRKHLLGATDGCVDRHPNRHAVPVTAFTADALLSDETKQAAIDGLSFRLGHTLNEAAISVVIEEALAALTQQPDPKGHPQ